MTTWQWQVIIALCKIVLRILQVGTANTIMLEEKQILEEAIRRSENAT